MAEEKERRQQESGDRSRITARGWLLGLGRGPKQLILMVGDAVILAGALWVALALRYSALDFPRGEQLDALYFILPATGVSIYWAFGLYRSMLRAMEAHTIRIVVAGAVVPTLLIPTYVWIDPAAIVPRSVPFIYFLIVIVTIGATRIALKGIFGYLSSNRAGERRVVVYGAGEKGRQIGALLQNSARHRLIAYLDDNPKLRSVRVRGRPVLSLEQVSDLAGRDGFDQFVLALPNTDASIRRQAVERLAPLGKPLRIMPEIDTVHGEHAGPTRARPVRIEDLLGRQSVEPIRNLIAQGITGKTILVSGAAGSIGAQLCREILAARPARLVALDVSEVGLYTLNEELAPLARNADLDFEICLGSVLDRAFLERTMMRTRPQVVYHAAAYKHVPIVEDNVLSAHENNVFGTHHIARAASEAQVERFVLVSTDKAVRPTNVMGATKRMAELVVQAMAEEASGTVFTMVRFGNVLGSSGSVIPLFERQIAEGGPVTLTHKEVTRYFMTIAEAAQLVLQAGFLAKGGEVFLLDMGEPVRLADLARLMIQLSGKRVREGQSEEGIEIREIGLRPGEKLYEELLIDQNASGTAHPKIMQAAERRLSIDAVMQLMNEARAAIDGCDEAAIIAQLRRHADLNSAKA